jgi:hypothetical protein
MLASLPVFAEGVLMLNAPVSEVTYYLPDGRKWWESIYSSYQETPKPPEYPHGVELRSEVEELGAPRQKKAMVSSAEDRRSAAVAMLERWARDAENLSDQEAAENTAVLRAIDEDRLSDRKLFTDILKDTPK